MLGRPGFRSRGALLLTSASVSVSCWIAPWMHTRCMPPGSRPAHMTISIFSQAQTRAFSTTAASKLSSMRTKSTGSRHLNQNANKWALKIWVFRIQTKEHSDKDKIFFSTPLSAVRIWLGSLRDLEFSRQWDRNMQKCQVNLQFRACMRHDQQNMLTGRYDPPFNPKP